MLREIPGGEEVPPPSHGQHPALRHRATHDEVAQPVVDGRGIREREQDQEDDAEDDKHGKERKPLEVHAENKHEDILSQVRTV